MPKRDRLDLARGLLRRARDDLVAVRELAENPRVADSVVGFHAQQAVEKDLKAVLAGHGVDFERTHDLDRLVDLLETTGTALPVDVDAVSGLTDFAVSMRYDDPLEGEPLDRRAALALVEKVDAWAHALLAPREDV